MMETINELEDQLLKLVRSIHTKGFQEGKEFGNEIGDMQGFEKGYDKGYEQGCKDCQAIYHNSVNYERGLNDAWDLVRKIIISPNCDDVYPWGTLLKIFGSSNIEDRMDIILNYSSSEALAKIKEYEEKQKEKQDREQEPKAGHWFIDERPESNREIICSNCEQPVFKFHKLDFDYRPHYCPNCGAKMG